MFEMRFSRDVAQLDHCTDRRDRHANRTKKLQRQRLNFSSLHWRHQLFRYNAQGSRRIVYRDT